MESVNCLLCGSENKRVVYSDCRDRMYRKPGRFRIVSCQVCGFSFLDPRPSSDEIHRFYEGYWLHEQASGETIRSMNLGGIKEKIKHFAFYPYFRKYGATGLDLLPQDFSGNRLLDVGCGNGGFLKHYQDNGWKIYGVDFSPDAILSAKKLLSVDTLYYGELTDCHFKDKSFDVITMYHLLEHVYDPVATLEEVRRTLKEDGLLVLRVPNIDSWESKVFGRNWMPLEVPRHLSHFSVSILSNFLERNGLKVIKVRHGLYPKLLYISIFYLMEALTGISMDMVRIDRIEGIPLRWLYRFLYPISFLLAMGGKSGEIEVWAKKG